MAELELFELLLMQADIVKEDLDRLSTEKSISDAEYNKNISILAYEYGINGFPDDCLLMLMNLKGDYFQEDAIQHFKDDESFFSKCYLMFEVLNFIGHVPGDAFATQPIAKA